MFGGLLNPTPLPTNSDPPVFCAAIVSNLEQMLHFDQESKGLSQSTFVQGIKITQTPNNS